jgi:hypothetical protein
MKVKDTKVVANPPKKTRKAIISFHPWDDTSVKALFLPNANEHPKDAIAQCIDIFMEAKTEPDGYITIIEGGILWIIVQS